MQGVLPSNQSVLLTRTVGERCQYFLSHSRKFTEKTYFCWVIVLAFVQPGTLNRKQADEAINPLFNHWHTGVAQTQCVILHKALRRKKVIDARNAYSYKFSTRYSCLFGFFFLLKSHNLEVGITLLLSLPKPLWMSNCWHVVLLFTATFILN